LKLIKGLLFALLFFFASYWWFPSARERRRILEVFSVAITAVSCLGILDFIVPLGLAAPSVEGRATGVLGDPNVLAGYLAVSAIVPLYLARMPELSATRRVLHLSAYGLAAVTVVLTLSRGGWLAMVAGHAVFFALTDRRLLVMGVVGLVVAATIAYPLLPDMVRERIEATLRPGQVVYQGQWASRVEASAGQRVTLWRVGFEIFQESPLWGRGLESVRILSPQYGAKYGLVQHRPPHNLFVKIIAEMGLIGLTVFSWLALTVLLYGWRLWRSESEERGLGAVFMASGAAFATSNLFAIVAFKSAVAICIWILIGLVGRASAESVATTVDPGRSLS
jgi:O-antigen ligase